MLGIDMTFSWLKGISLTIALSAGLTFSADACSRIRPDPTPYSEVLSGLQSMAKLDLIRGASAIYLAQAVEQLPSDTPLLGSGVEENAIFATDYRLQVQQVLKGQKLSEFWYRAGPLNGNLRTLPLRNSDGEIVSGTEESGSLDAGAAATSRHQYFRFWLRDSEPRIGEFLRLSDCNDYTYFEIGHDYLVFLDEEGRMLSAEHIPSLSDPWFEAVQYALGNPGAETLGRTTLEQIFTDMRVDTSLIVVEQCGPSPHISRTDPTSRGVSSSKPLDGGGRSGTRTWYDLVPFNEASCQTGAQYLAITYGGQWFPMDSEEIVDFSDFAFSKRVTGQTKISLSQIIEWLDN